jgi:hypothetical protein
MRAFRFLGLAMLAGWLAAAADRELTGRVVDANTGEPVARAHVTLRFFQGGQPAPEVTLLSDADGTFRITNLPAGGFQISCQKSGYLPGNQAVSPNAGANSTDGKNASTVVVRLVSQAAIEGTVVDDKDMPAENTFIQLLSQQVANGRRVYQPTGGGATDETGSFRIYGLTAGRYYISIMARLNGARRTKPLAYPQLYYPNATDLAAAQPIDLKAGDELQIKVRLPEPVPAFEVRGVVATTAPNVGVTLARQGSGPMFQQSVGDSSWDAQAKTFRISHVTPGMYLLTASAQDGRNSMQANTIVTVGNADVSGIALEPATTGIDGIVRMEGDTGQQRAGGYVALSASRFGNGAPVDVDGKFHIANVPPETYRIAPQIPDPQWCVRSILEGGRDVRDGLTVTAGVSPGPVEIVLTNHCGGIEGTVTRPDSGLPPNVSAYLLHKAGNELVMEKQVYFADRGGGDSMLRFTMTGVTPGDYMLYVMDSQVEYANAEYMRQFESYGQEVTVTADSKASVTVDKILTSPAKN